MKITLRYMPAAGSEDEFKMREQRRTFEVPENARLTDILPQVYGSGLARWDDASREVTGSFLAIGRVEPNATYSIRSEDIPRTIKALDELKDLKF